jgi:cysteine desulfurase/selenocysteine lyase
VRTIERATVQAAMQRIGAWNRTLTARALERLAALPGLTIYGPRDAARRSALVAFNVAGRNPIELAQALNARGVESRAGCHCATLAHQALGLALPASCRLSFYFYNTLDEVDRAVDALETVLSANQVRERIWNWLRARPTLRLRRGVASA